MKRLAKSLRRAIRSPRPRATRTSRTTAESQSPAPVVLEVESTANDLVPSPKTSQRAAVRAPSVYNEGGSALSLYMRDAVEVPLLSIQEEIELAARIKRGDLEAREHMIRANLRLVVKIARDYDGFGLPLLDLINEGNIGLMKGVERFDPAKGGKLSTYASWWIKQSIKRALANQSKMIRLPVHLVDKISRMKKAAARLHEEFGREPEVEELAEELRVTPKKVRLWQAAAMKTASLDEPLSDEDSSRLGDVVADVAAPNPYESLAHETTHHMVRNFLGILDDRELTILRRRFGLDGQKEKTLDEIGKQFGVTRERIRQLQNIALAKLRNRIEQFEAVRGPDQETDPLRTLTVEPAM